MPASQSLVKIGSCFLAVLVGATPLHAQGTLERMRRATHEGPHFPSPPAPAKPSPSSSPSYPSGPGAGDAEGLGYLVGGAALVATVVATSPFWVPHIALGDDLDVPGYFPGCPYGLDWTGYMDIDYDGFATTKEQQTQLGDPDYVKPWAFRFSVEDGNDFGGLNRTESQFFLDTTTRFGVESRWDQFVENVGGRIDESLLGDTELTYRFVQREWIEMHAGLGFRLLVDHSDTRAGVNFVYGSDLYPMKPLVVSSFIALGTLDVAFVVQGRITMGVTWRNWELMAGYDLLRIGSVNLQGPLLGLRCWY